MRHGEGNVLKDQVYCERLGASPLNSVECGAAQASLVYVTWNRYLAMVWLLSLRHGGTHKKAHSALPEVPEIVYVRFSV